MSTARTDARPGWPGRQELIESGTRPSAEALARGRRPVDMPGHRTRARRDPRRARAAELVVEHAAAAARALRLGPRADHGRRPVRLLPSARAASAGRRTLLVYPPVVGPAALLSAAGEPAGRGPLPPAHALRHPECLRRARVRAGRRLQPHPLASTARTGELMVKTFELDPASDIWILLDLEGRCTPAGRREHRGVRRQDRRLDRPPLPPGNRTVGL